MQGEHLTGDLERPARDEGQERRSRLPLRDEGSTLPRDRRRGARCPHGRKADGTTSETASKRNPGTTKPHPRPIDVVRIVSAWTVSVLVLGACSGDDSQGPLLTGTLRDGETVTYGAEEVIPGKTRITCFGEGGGPVSAVVSQPGGGVSGSGYGEEGSSTISLTTNPDGSVVAECDAS
jgi:hypothetical protein